MAASVTGDGIVKFPNSRAMYLSFFFFSFSPYFPTLLFSSFYQFFFFIALCWFFDFFAISIFFLFICFYLFFTILLLFTIYLTFVFTIFWYFTFYYFFDYYKIWCWYYFGRKWQPTFIRNELLSQLHSFGKIWTWFLWRYISTFVPK